MIKEISKRIKTLKIFSGISTADTGVLNSRFGIQLNADPIPDLKRIDGKLQPVLAALLQYDPVLQCWKPFDTSLFPPATIASVGITSSIDLPVKNKAGDTLAVDTGLVMPDNIEVNNVNNDYIPVQPAMFKSFSVDTTITTTTLGVTVAQDTTALKIVLTEWGGWDYYLQLGNAGFQVLPGYSRLILDWYCGSFVLLSKGGHHTFVQHQVCKAADLR